MSRSVEGRNGVDRLGRPAGLPKRWSALRKAEVVVRLLRGEDIGEVSRESFEDPLDDLLYGAGPVGRSADGLTSADHNGTLYGGG